LKHNQEKPFGLNHVTVLKLTFMTPVGENLRRERLKRNLELEEISRELKISMRFLQAIENDQYDKLPGGVFAKSFARQYARLLGLNEEDIAGQVQQVVGPVEVPQPVETPKPMAFSSIHVPKVDEWQTVGDRRFHWSGWLSAVVLVAVMLVCSAVYAWLQRPKATVTAQANPPAASVPQHAATQNVPPGTPPVVATGTPGSVAAQPVPPTAQPDATPPQAVPPQVAPPQAPPLQALDQRPLEQKPPEPKPAPAGAQTTPVNAEAAVHVEINASEAVWVLARADGKYAFSATMDPNTTRTVEGVKQVMVRLGNAGGVTISLNGKPIGPAGPKGQVRTIQFTSGGFQIVPAKPPVVVDPLFDRF
jgi:cytoskeleton protein RodZ